VVEGQKKWQLSINYQYFTVNSYFTVAVKVEGEVAGELEVEIEVEIRLERLYYYLFKVGPLNSS
jgi:hypothetical protein